jgi:5-methyltetrahydrofolate--homocysteine methyltransferase
MPVDEMLTQLKDTIVKGNKEEATEQTKRAIEAGIDASKILEAGIVKATEEVGELYERMEYYLPDLLIAADAMIASMEILKPHLKQMFSAQLKGTILVGSVEGDVHSIGKNLIITLLEGQGYEVIDLGTDVPPTKFVEKAKEINPDVIGLSGLLTTSIMVMRDTVLQLKEENITSKVIVGGGILSKEACEMIGADDFATDGWTGLKKIKEFIDSIKSGL